MFRYRLYTADGDELGEATYAVMIKPGETIYVDNGRELRVLDVVPTQKHSGGRYVGLLKVEAA
jgi:hypothetical protein